MAQAAKIPAKIHFHFIEQICFAVSFDAGYIKSAAWVWIAEIRFLASKFEMSLSTSINQDAGVA
jgi:hypothetical protein